MKASIQHSVFQLLKKYCPLSQVMHYDDASFSKFTMSGSSVIHQRITLVSSSKDFFLSFLQTHVIFYFLSNLDCLSFVAFSLPVADLSLILCLLMLCASMHIVLRFFSRYPYYKSCWIIPHPVFPWRCRGRAFYSPFPT